MLKEIGHRIPEPVNQLPLLEHPHSCNKKKLPKQEQSLHTVYQKDFVTLQLGFLCIQGQLQFEGFGSSPTQLKPARGYFSWIIGIYRTHETLVMRCSRKQVYSSEFGYNTDIWLIFLPKSRFILVFVTRTLEIVFKQGKDMNTERANWKYKYKYTNTAEILILKYIFKTRSKRYQEYI